MPLAFATPPISVSTAHALAAFFTVSYVGSLYLSKGARLYFKNGVKVDTRPGEEPEKDSEERWRNDPDVIRARLVAASMSTALSVGVVYWLVRSVTPESEVCLCFSVLSRVSCRDGEKKGLDLEHIPLNIGKSVGICLRISFRPFGVVLLTAADHMHLVSQRPIRIITVHPRTPWTHP